MCDQAIERRFESGKAVEWALPSWSAARAIAFIIRSHSRTRGYAGINPVLANAQ
jgi:hypothetical protein